MEQRRARILLHANTGVTDAAIAAAVLVSARTVARVRSQFAHQGLQAALGHSPRRFPPRRKLDGAAEARLVTIACSSPPAGRATWTMQLLADELVRLDIVDTISDEAVRTTLKKTISNPG
jgi:transposase